MEESIAPVPGDEPSDDAEVEPLPDFEEADDGVLDVHMEAGETVGTLTAKGKAFRPNRAEAIALSDLIRTFATALYKIALAKSKLGDFVAPTDVDDFQFASAHIRFVAGEHETFRIDGAGSPTAEAAQQITSLMQVQDDDLLALAQETGRRRKGLQAIHASCGSGRRCRGHLAVQWGAGGRSDDQRRGVQGIPGSG